MLIDRMDAAGDDWYRDTAPDLYVNDFVWLTRLQSARRLTQRCGAENVAELRSSLNGVESFRNSVRGPNYCRLRVKTSSLPLRPRALVPVTFRIRKLKSRDLYTISPSRLSTPRLRCPPFDFPPISRICMSYHAASLPSRVAKPSKQSGLPIPLDALINGVVDHLHSTATSDRSNSRVPESSTYLTRSNPYPLPFFSLLSLRHRSFRDYDIILLLSPLCLFGFGLYLGLFSVATPYIFV